MLQSPVLPPAAPRRERTVTVHGDARSDPWHWLRERGDPRVLAHLEAENAYADQVLEPGVALQERLFAETLARIPGDDRSAFDRIGEYLYYRRFEAACEHPLLCRRRDSPTEPEEILLDVGRLGAGHPHVSLRGVAVSPRHDRIAYALDLDGRGTPELRVRDLASGRDLRRRVPGAAGAGLWSADGEALLYVRLHPSTLRPYQAWLHRPGTDAADELLYEERDDTFRVELARTTSRRYLLIVCRQMGRTTEVYRMHADRPTDPRPLLPRRPGHSYFVDHQDGYFYLRTDAGAPNFRVVRMPEEEPRREHWQELVPNSDGALICDFAAFPRFLVVAERCGGPVRLRVRSHEDGAEHLVTMEEPAGFLALHPHQAPDSDAVRFVTSSPRRPPAVVSYDMAARRRWIEKQDEAGGGFDAARYRVARLEVPARDGERIPVSLVCRRDLPQDGTAPLLLHGYGAYGHCLDAAWEPALPSLLDRGFVYAIAHVRGGQERGREWYEDGRLLRKMNTFHDFIDCAEHLASSGHADRSRLFALGASAGGLLVGAVANMRPDLFRGMVARVPFVDLLNSMLDDTIPLTTNEYGEWGDPRRDDHYAAMREYSPYDNVAPRPYPHMLVLAALHDPFVSYWEPAKYVARLRAATTGDGVIVLRTDMAAGHLGAPGRFERQREASLIHAFLLRLAGCDETGSEEA